MRNAVDLVAQLLHAETGRTDRLYDRSAEETAQLFKIEVQPALLRIVDHIEHQQHRQVKFGQLRGQVKVALGVAGVDDVQDQVDPAVQKLLKRDLLLRRGVRQTVNARQVDDLDLEIVDPAHAALAFDRHAGVVADMLPGAGQLVENRGFSAVRVTRERDPVNMLIHDKKQS